MTLKEFGSAKIPAGVIVPWMGSLGSIPAGWVLCDGNNGTPNLLDRYIRSPSSGEAVGETGGQDNYSLSTSQMADHDHTASMDSAGYHSHGYYDRHQGYGSDGGTSATANSPSTSSGGSHSHSGGEYSVATGSGNTIDNRPNTVTVAFIQKT